jgi:hypothetical protein
MRAKRKGGADPIDLGAQITRGMQALGIKKRNSGARAEV